MIEPELSKIIVDVFYIVYNKLGFGFLESVYKNALAIEFRKRGIRFEREVLIEALYDGMVVGTFRADFIVEERILLEIKSTKCLTDADDRQHLNYLRSSRVELGYLLHFGPRPQFRRLIFTNDRK